MSKERNKRWIAGFRRKGDDDWTDQTFIDAPNRKVALKKIQNIKAQLYGKDKNKYAAELSTMM